jgi:hypothetical protein
MREQHVKQQTAGETQPPVQQEAIELDGAFAGFRRDPMIHKQQQSLHSTPVSAFIYGSK